jgi:predicted cupin superfamily sugar epimerase
MSGSGRAKSAQDIIQALSLRPHPEGGYFRETFRDTLTVEDRSVSTAIYYLLAQGRRSHWHRVDATEIWHWYGGAPLALSVKTPERLLVHRLGMDLSTGEAPQAIVPAGLWQSAQSLGDWTLVGCTVAPGFEFSRFEVAPGDWHPA